MQEVLKMSNVYDFKVYYKTEGSNKIAYMLVPHISDEPFEVAMSECIQQMIPVLHEFGAELFGVAYAGSNAE